MLRRVEKKRSKLASKRNLVKKEDATLEDALMREKETLYRIAWTEEAIATWDDEPVSIEELASLWYDQDAKCALTQRRMTTAINDPDAGSLDRIDSTKGYIAGNVQWVCAWVNIMKGPMHERLFFDRCELLFQCRDQWRQRRVCAVAPVWAGWYHLPES